MTESFADFVERVPGFHSIPLTDRILHAAWYLHSVRGIPTVTTSSINECFASVHTAGSHTSIYLKRMAERKPALFLRSANGYKLEGRIRQKLEQAFGGASRTFAVSALLRSLLKKVNASTERVFLEETLNCYSVGAFRASIVMSWNLAYSHIESWLLADPKRVSAFNTSYGAKFPKKSERITNADSFAEFKEFDVVETLAHAKLVSKNIGEILKDKLKKRNAAAHPSSIAITQAQADDVITDLVNNLVARLG